MPVTNVNGININYKVEGEGEPLVLIAGFGLDLGKFKSQVPLLRRYYKVITFDNRGAGKTDKPKGPYSIRGMADDTVGLMDYLGIDKASILGFSMGGMIAQEIAINYPHRVTKLVLCSTYACQDQESGLTIEARKLDELPTFRAVSGFLSLCFNSIFRRVFNFILIILTSNKNVVVALQAQDMACANHNAFDRLYMIQASTLVIVGTDDKLIRTSSSEVLATKIPQAKLVTIRNGSHMMKMEMSKEFNTEVLNFLRG